MAIISLRAYNIEIEGMIDNAQLDEAVAHCRHILATFPKHIATYRLLGKAHLEQQRISDATDIFQRVLTAIPDDFVANLGMSIIREDENNLDAAIWHMELAYEAQPANLAIQDELRRLYGRRDGVQPAKVRLTRGALARMYAKGGLYDQAIAELRAAIAEDPNRPDLQVLLAQMFFQTAQRVEAVETCVNILKKLPVCLEANRILAVSLPETEGSDSVRNYRQIAVSMDPYFAFAEPEAIASDQVPESAVNIERLDWKSGIQVGEVPSQPTWATSLGISLEKPEDENIPDWLKSAEAAVPPTPSENASPGASPFIWDTQEVEKIITETSKPEGELPDWMKDAGWQPASGEVTPPTEEIKPVPLNADASVNEELQQADIPDWLKGVAPEGVLGAEQPPETPKEDELSNPWLEPHQPGPTDSIIHWLEEEKPVRSDAAPTPADDASQVLDDEVPDWLKDLDVPQPSSTPTAGTPEEAPGAFPETPAFIEEPPFAETLQAQPEASLPETPAEPGSEAAPAEGIEEVPDWLRQIAAELPSAGAFIAPEPVSTAEPGLPAEQSLSEQAVPPEEQIPEAAEELAAGAQAAPIESEQPEVEAAPSPEELLTEQALPEAELAPGEVQLPGEEVPTIPPGEAEILAEAQGEAPIEALPGAEAAGAEEPVEEAAVQAEIPPVPEELIPAEGEPISAAAQPEVAETPEVSAALESATPLEKLPAEEQPIPIEQAPLEEELPAAVEELPEVEIPIVTEEQPVAEQPELAQEETPATEALPEPGIEEFAWLEDLAAEQSKPEEPLVAPPEEGEISPPEWVKLEMEPTSEEIAPAPAQAAEAEAAFPAQEVPEWIKGLGEEPEIEPAPETPAGTSIIEPEIPHAEELPAWLLEMEQPEPEKEPSIGTEEPLAWEAEQLPDWLKEMAESGEPEAAPLAPEPAITAETPAASLAEESAPAEEIILPAEELVPEITQEPPVAEVEAPGGAILQPVDEELATQAIQAQPEVEELTPEVALEQPASEVVMPEVTPQQPATAQVEALEVEQPVPTQELVPPEVAAEPAVMEQQAAPQAAEPEAPELEVAAIEPVEGPTATPKTILIEARDALVQQQPEQAAQLFAGLIKQDYHLEEIVKDLQDALYSFPLNIDMWITLGEALNRTHDLQEALNAYTKAEELVR